MAALGHTTALGDELELELELDKDIIQYSLSIKMLWLTLKKEK